MLFITYRNINDKNLIWMGKMIENSLLQKKWEWKERDWVVMGYV